MGGGLSSVRFWRLPACVQCRFTANRTVLCCSAQCIHGLADYMVRLSCATGANTQTRSCLKIAFHLLSFYPFIPVIYLVFFNCRGSAGGFPASKFVFFIPLEIDVEGTEMPSKRSKMPPPKRTHFTVILTHHCMSVVGSPCSFRGFFGAMLRQASKT